MRLSLCSIIPALMIGAAETAFALDDGTILLDSFYSKFFVIF
jgi:hypothetical protein